MEKRRSQAFLQSSGAESQPSLLVPVTEGYCCKGATALVTKHSCLLISKAEMLKAKVGEAEDKQVPNNKVRKARRAARRRKY